MGDSVVQRMLHDSARRRSVLEFRDGSCLAIGAGLVSYGRDAAAFDDPLGNGVRAAFEIPAALAPQWQDGSGHVQELSGGAVLLHGGSVVLIKPYSIELYASGMDALHGRDCRGRMDLPL
ncbi:MAG: hypothetical protein ACOY3X_07570 [Pseudomonadota bacterium]